LSWFSVVALVGIVILVQIGRWYGARLRESHAARSKTAETAPFSRRRVAAAITLLVLLVFSKNFYTASLTSYYIFYLIQKFGLSVQTAQIYLFVFLGSVALGTIIGGPIGDRFGRKIVIWGSILGVLPFTLILPHADLFWTVVLTVPIGLIMASSFPAIVVFAQELVPGRVGVVSGLFFGVTFGMAGLGAAVLGEIADRTSIEFVYQLCAYLPAIGLLAVFLPDTRERPAKAA
jgi:FSR family fosmidomycin resistance protein-like MFS transporter